MARFTGYLLGKVQLDGAIRSEVLTSLVENLTQMHPIADSNKKISQLNENHKYLVECSERGLKLTSPGCRSKDEGFESDSESMRSVKLGEGAELSLCSFMDELEIKDEMKETESQVSSSPSSPGGSSLDSSSRLQIQDDSNSSSGNGSDSDEFGISLTETRTINTSISNNNNKRSPYWEILPNLSSFQSYPIEDVIFCHCDTIHPSTLVWVVRHLEKMIALPMEFRTRSEAEELFELYRDLRLKLKPIKYKINPILGVKIHEIPPAPNSPAPSPPFSNNSNSNSSDGEISSTSTSAFTSLQPVYPMAILYESHQSTLFSSEPKSLGFEMEGSLFSNARKNFETGTGSSASSTLTREPLSRSGSNSLSLHNHVYVSNPNILRHSEINERKTDATETCDDFGWNDSSEDNSESQEDSNSNFNNSNPIPPQRAAKHNNSNTHAHAHTYSPMKTIQSHQSQSQSAKEKDKAVVLVPLKSESVATTRSSYPKESYLYHVMGRSSSTFAPYQRSLNFLPHQYGLTNGGEYMAYGNGGHLVPFASWLELSEMSKMSPHAQNNPGRKTVSKGSHKSGGRISALGAKGTTSKILLRDSTGRSTMWASLSQRFKINLRENLIPKLNGMWSQSESGRKKRQSKKVTFNAWATVQMV